MRFPLCFMENKWVEPALNSLLLVRPRSEEQSLVKKSMEKTLRSLLKIYNSNGEVLGTLSVDRKECATAVKLFIKIGTALCG